MACKIIRDKKTGAVVGVNAPNGKPSELYKELATIVGNQDAYEMYAYTQTKEFTDWFGMKWNSNPNAADSLFTDDNGEPKLIYGNGKVEWMNTDGDLLTVTKAGVAAKARANAQSIAVTKAQNLVDPALETEILDIASTFVSEARKQNPEFFRNPNSVNDFFNPGLDAKGKPIDNGTLAKMLLGESFEGLSRSQEDLNTAVDLYNTWKESGRDFNALRNNLPEGVTLTPVGEIVFFDVYDRWNSQINEATGNIETVGWRDKIQDRLANHGMKMTSEGEMLVEMDETPVRIYSVARLQENPRDRLSAEAKSALAGIKYDNPNSILKKLLGQGYQTDMPIDMVYGELAQATAEQSSFPAMLAELEQRAKYKPELTPIVERLRGLEPNQQAAIFSNFALAYKQFLLFRIERGIDAEGNVKVTTKMSNPNENDTARRYRTRYNNNSIERQAPNPRALYKEDAEGNLEVIPEKLAAADNAWERLERATTNLRPNDPVPSEAVDALGDYLWSLGMQYGPTLETTKANLTRYFTIGGFIGGRPANGMLLFNNYINPSYRGKKKPLASLREVARQNKNIYTREGSTINKIASIAPLFDSKYIGSFISGTNKSYYPVNLPTTLDEVVLNIKSKQGNELLQTMLQDPLYNPGSDFRHQSVLVTRLLNSPTFREAFEEEGIRSLDSLKEANGNISDYDEQSSRSSLIVRLNAFANNNNASLTRIAIPTMPGRNLDFMIQPRYDNQQAAGVSKEDIIKGLILQDLARLDQADKQVKRARLTGDTSKLIEGYHYKKGSIPTNADGTIFTEDGAQLEGLNLHEEYMPGSPTSKEGLKRLASQVEEYVSGNERYRISPAGQHFEARLNSLVEQVKDKLNKYEDDVTAQIEKFDITLREEVHTDMSTRKDFVKSFVFNDFVGRIEAAKLLRGGFGFTKDTKDFYKRMALVTTPGQKLLIAGEAKGDPTYGMMPYYNAITVADFNFIDSDRANQVADRMRDNLIAAGNSVEVANTISEKYTNANAGLEKTDAQSFISTEMYRGIMQGMGQWGERDNQAYANDKAGLGWVDDNGNPVSIYPIKPYHEELTLRNGTMTLSMDKNSYTIVTNEIANEFPELRKMHNAMEGGKVHVINMRSATKGAKSNVQDLQNQAELDTSNVTIMNSKGLRLPQIITKKKAEKILMSRQIRKNIIANIVADANYTVDGQTMKGAEVFARFQDIVSENILEDTNNFNKSMGITRLQKAERDTQEYADAKLDHLKKVRDRLAQQVKDRELPANYLKGLDIVPNGRYDWRFRVPLSFPNYQAKFEQILLSTVKQDIFNQMIKGKELVQIAEAGGHGVDGELRMYDGTNRAEVRIKASTLGLSPGTDIADVDPKVLEVIGYRVPNQGKNSSLPIKVVGFLPESHEKAIMVPGGVTVQMGSDFDIDKMYIIQPETEIVDGKMQRVGVDFAKDPSKMNRQERDTALYSLMDSIITSPTHLREVLNPLDDPKLYDLGANLLRAGTIEDRNHPLVELTQEERNKSGQRLTGLWANFLSGHNVLSNNPLQSKVAINLNGESLNMLGMIQAVDGTYVDQNISLYLSAAVDAAKKPVQVDINDNLYTVPVAGFMLSVGVPVQDVVHFLSQPIIQEVIEESKVNGYGLNRMSKAISTVAKKYKGVVPELISPMSSAKLEESAVGAATEVEELNIPAEQLAYLGNFKQFFEVGRQLQTLNQLITPDTLENVNEMSAIAAHLEREDAFFRDPESSLIKGGAEFVSSNRDGTRPVYPISIAYRGILQTALNTAETAGLINNRPAFFTFKQILKQDLNINTLTPAQHKFIDKALFLKMMADRNSPLAPLMSEQAARAMYTGPNNIAARLTALKEKYPGLSRNSFVESLQEDPANNDANAKVFKVKFDNSSDLTAHDKNRLSNDLLLLVTRPESYANNQDNAQEAAEIKQLGKMIVANQLLTNGFAPGPGAYIDLIPVEAFTTNILSDSPIALTPIEFFANNAETTLLNETFQDFVHDFVRSFGTAKPGGRNILPVVRYKGMPGTKTPGIPNSVPMSKQTAVHTKNKGFAAYFVTYHPTEGPIMYVRESANPFVGNYKRLQPLGVPGKMHEILSSKDSMDSIIPSEGTTDLPGANYVSEPAAKDIVMPESVEQPLKLCKA